jgi:hypothetical protein
VHAHQKPPVFEPVIKNRRFLKEPKSFAYQKTYGFLKELKELKETVFDSLLTSKKTAFFLRPCLAFCKKARVGA